MPRPVLIALLAAQALLFLACGGPTKIATTDPPAADQQNGKGPKGAGWTEVKRGQSLYLESMRWELRDVVLDKDGRPTIRIDYELQNMSDTKIVRVESWHLGAFLDTGKLTDDFGNNYTVITNDQVLGRWEFRPKQGHRAFVTFVAPVEKAEVVYLELPGGNVGVPDGAFRLKLSRALWDKNFVPTKKEEPGPEGKEPAAGPKGTVAGTKVGTGTAAMTGTATGTKAKK